MSIMKARSYRTPLSKKMKDPIKLDQYNSTCISIDTAPIINFSFSDTVERITMQIFKATRIHSSLCLIDAYFNEYCEAISDRGERSIIKRSSLSERFQ